MSTQITTPTPSSTDLAGAISRTWKIYSGRPREIRFTEIMPRMDRNQDFHVLHTKIGTISEILRLEVDHNRDVVNRIIEKQKMAEVQVKLTEA
ncbi:uncharacterized protein PGRI_049140 [Penicillium griseofulvum]|uniref:Uncharacterized protein n=1 Tax=Penicillium patulum TaxID=5078 RepID=A0A135LAP7_PENPA|nr:uncharacterized protein PGRI_049140 [Penicillium griseofulvum]KXG46058.1 hypothetical protein PGRI_049140 [Penicillium griseofulvum]